MVLARLYVCPRSDFNSVTTPLASIFKVHLAADGNPALITPVAVIPSNGALVARRASGLGFVAVAVAVEVALLSYSTASAMIDASRGVDVGDASKDASGEGKSNDGGGKLHFDELNV